MKSKINVNNNTYNNTASNFRLVADNTTINVIHDHTQLANIKSPLIGMLMYHCSVTIVEL